MVCSATAVNCTRNCSKQWEITTGATPQLSETMGKATQASSLTLEETERFKADHRGGLHCAMLAKPSDIKKPHRVYRCHVHGRPGLSVQQVEQRPRPDALQAEQTWVLLQAPHQRAGGYCGVR